MADRSSGFRIDVSGLAPAALMSSSTAASHEKVRRAEGTCNGVRSLSLTLALSGKTELLSSCSNLCAGARAILPCGYFPLVTLHMQSVHSFNTGSSVIQAWGGLLACLKQTQSQAAIRTSCPGLLAGLPESVSHCSLAPSCILPSNSLVFCLFCFVLSL